MGTPPGHLHATVDSQMGPPIRRPSTYPPTMRATILGCVTGRFEADLPAFGYGSTPAEREFGISRSRRFASTWAASPDGSSARGVSLLELGIEANGCPMQALEGLKVLELGQLIAGPFAAKTLADFGADVIKIEPAGVGDPLRKWRMLRDGTSVWWQVQSRNKRSVALDLRSAEGQEAVRAAGDGGRRADRELQARHAGRLGPRLGARCMR